MIRRPFTASVVAIIIIAFWGSSGCRSPKAPAATPLRLMTYNLEDVRTDDLVRPDHPRLKAAAAVIQRLRPDILFLNEIAYDQPGVPGFTPGDEPGQNGRRFAEIFLAESQGPGLEPVYYTVFMAESNTGIASGFDLDHDGRSVTKFPVPPPAADDGTPARQTADGRAYGNDSWGFGTFPGQYAMALLVRRDLRILTDDVRTFRHFRWRDLPDGARPVDPETGAYWYSDEIWNRFPLSSKSHWDVPIEIDEEHVLHILASHPTPAAFDGPEARNKLRNRAEIMFWRDYIDGADFITDDTGQPGGLPPNAAFVVMGDLNADPDEGSAIDDPVGVFLLQNPSVNGTFVPRADSSGITAFPDLDADDTAQWGMRVDYVLPSSELEILGGRIVREATFHEKEVSDHFPVYLDVILR